MPMIPKIIHYCWFGGAEKPNLIKHCISSWKKRLPDYEIKEWNEHNFDVNMAPLCREAYAAKKWAFVADYCRIYALATEGGIYLDTDIIILKPFDDILDYQFYSSQEFQPWVFKDDLKNLDDNGCRKPEFTGHIKGMGIQSGVMMAEKGTPYIMDCLNYYNQLHLPQNLSDIIVCRILSQLLEKYGYRYVTERQVLNDNTIVIDQPHVFSNMTFLNSASYAWHLYYRSWGGKFNLKQRIRNNFSRLYLLSQLIYYRKFSFKLIRNAIF